MALYNASISSDQGRIHLFFLSIHQSGGLFASWFVCLLICLSAILILPIKADIVQNNFHI